MTALRQFISVCLLLLGIGAFLFGLVEMATARLSIQPAQGRWMRKEGAAVLALGMMLITLAVKMGP